MHHNKLGTEGSPGGSGVPKDKRAVHLVVLPELCPVQLCWVSPGHLMALFPRPQIPPCL